MKVASKPDQLKRQALEAYLVAAARTGDRAALDQLVRLAGPGLYAHALRLLGESDLARDIVQAAWVEILRGLPALRDNMAFRPFALKIVSRRVARVIRGRQKDRVLAVDWANEAPTHAAPNGETAALAAQIRAAIADLPTDQRATLALFYLHDLSVAQVADAMDVPIGTVKTRLMHARLKLKAKLEGDDNDQT